MYAAFCKNLRIFLVIFSLKRLTNCLLTIKFIEKSIKFCLVLIIFQLATQSTTHLNNDIFTSLQFNTFLCLIKKLLIQNKKNLKIVSMVIKTMMLQAFIKSNKLFFCLTYDTRNNDTWKLNRLKIGRNFPGILSEFKLINKWAFLLFSTSIKIFFFNPDASYFTLISICS